MQSPGVLRSQEIDSTNPPTWGLCDLSAFLGFRVGSRRNVNKMVEVELRYQQSHPLHTGPWGVETVHHAR